MSISKASPVKIDEYSKMVPTDIQSRYSKTIQTHNAVSVGANGSSNGGWVDCDGFDKIAITVDSDATTTETKANIHWSHDGVTIHGTDLDVVLGTSATLPAGITEIKAKYARVALFNNDAAAHTMSAWAYLKA